MVPGTPMAHRGRLLGVAESSSGGILEIDVDCEKRRLPVYSIRNFGHHREIARALASGKKAVIFGMGLWGIVKAVEDPRTQRRITARRGSM